MKPFTFKITMLLMIAIAFSACTQEAITPEQATTPLATDESQQATVETTQNRNPILTQLKNLRYVVVITNARNQTKRMPINPRNVQVIEGGIRIFIDTQRLIRQDPFFRPGILKYRFVSLRRLPIRTDISYGYLRAQPEMFIVGSKVGRPGQPVDADQTLERRDWRTVKQISLGVDLF